jgi:hypothetical protein
VPESRSDDADQLDPLGAALASAGVAMLVFPLVQGRELGWPAWAFVLMALSVPVLAGFAVHQVRRRRAGRSPLVELAAVSLPMVGFGSGVLNATQQLGSTAGVATLGTMSFGRLDRGDALGGLQSVLVTTAALILSTAALAFLLPRYARESDAATAAVTDPASADEGALCAT